MINPNHGQRFYDWLNRKYKVTRPLNKMTPQEIRAFNNQYISTVIKRTKILRYNGRLPKRVGKFNHWFKSFWVDIT